MFEKRNRFLLIIFTISILFSCKKEDPVNPDNQQNNQNSSVTHDVTFLKKGASISYGYSDSFNDDTVITVIEDRLSTDTFMVRNFTGLSYFHPTQYWVLDGGDFYTSFRLRDRSKYVLECKFNKPVGTSWAVSRSAGIYTYTIDALDVTVSTNKGDIKDVVKVRASLPGGDIAYYYFSPSVGPLGTGNDATTSGSLAPFDYTTGQEVSAGNNLPPISYGSFDFLKVGHVSQYENYDYSTSESETLRIEVVKEVKPNLFQVKHSWINRGESFNQYYFEDRGMLMIYEEGETVLQADPVYMKEDNAKVGYGWSGLTLSGTTYIYKISELNVMQSSTHGTYNCMEITVSSGLFSAQENYWSKIKGLIYTSALMNDIDLYSANFRNTVQNIPFIPVIGINN